MRKEETSESMSKYCKQTGRKAGRVIQVKVTRGDAKRKKEVVTETEREKIKEKDKRDMPLKRSKRR